VSKRRSNDSNQRKPIAGRRRTAEKADPKVPDGFAEIRELAKRLVELHQAVAAACAPVVEDIIRSKNRDAQHIERTLDALLDACGHDAALMLYRRLCRHYWDIDPRATAQYIQFYREMWDEDASPDDEFQEPQGRD
jgi:hypothetical protein